MRHLKCIISTLVIFLTSCNISRHIDSNAYLVRNVSVNYPQQLPVSESEINSCLKINPNRKWLFIFDFYPWWYSLFDDAKIQQKKALRSTRIIQQNKEREHETDSINAIRISRGKTPKVLKLRDPNSELWIESLRDIGEPPVLYDKQLLIKTKTQLTKLLTSKGYLNAWISDSNTFNMSKKFAYIGLNLHPETTFKIINWHYSFENPNDSLMQLFKQDSLNANFINNRVFSADLLFNERERMTQFAKARGYYFFENNFISFKADTLGLPPGTMNIEVCVAAFASQNNTSMQEHPRLQWHTISVLTPDELQVNGTYAGSLDSVWYRSILFRSSHQKPYKKQIILRELKLHPGNWYAPDDLETTYKKLVNTGIFKSVSIQVKPDTLQGKVALNASVICVPPVKQIISAETEGTNTFGNLGIDANIVYRNRNVFKAGEILELKLQGAISSQSQFNTNSDNQNIEGLQRNFNTIQFGPELSFIFPKAYGLFSWSKPILNWNPRSYVKINANIQTRPQFSRSIWSIDYGFNFKNQNGTIRHDFIPFELYSVKMGVFSDAFKDSLFRYNDAFLINSFQDHITTLMRYSASFSRYDYLTTLNKTNILLRWNVISSGSILRQLFILTKQKSDQNGQYELFSVPFAQFFKTDLDFRVNMHLKGASRLIWRINAGIGIPFKNLGVLPYEQSFFCGGPNSVRAWRSRTLGPGAYNPGSNTMRFDKIGDILIETNLEYRFHLLRAFYGALFVDAGNIWRLYPDANKPEGVFNLNTFYKQIAVGSGFGFRWDLDFFVLRLDLAVPLKDPKNWKDENTWLFSQKPLKYIITNFGIGYPF